MKFPKIEIDEDIISEIAKEFRIDELYLFGSVIREDFSDSSDIDILVQFSKDIDYSYFDLLHIKEKFSHALNHPIDLVEKEALINPFRKEEILKTARLIYAA